jgi:hypothetical protein
MNTNAESLFLYPLGSIYKDSGGALSLQTLGSEGGCLYYFYWWGQILHHGP